MRPLSSLLVLFFLLSCSTDKISDQNILDAYVASNEIVFDNVIACAASNEKDDRVSIFLYPRSRANNINYFETTNDLVDKKDLSKYTLGNSQLTNVFNGYLKKFEIESIEDKWVIVSFEEDGKTHLSNPIHLKKQSKPTVYLPENIMVDATSGMPVFSWRDGQYGDTRIYFQVVSDYQDNLLSGTYTYDKMFVYYELDNVVLNITKTAPPVLSNENPYSFTLMGVSGDNWVNQFSSVEFEIK